jgi:hypothetical protein
VPCPHQTITGHSSKSTVCDRRIKWAAGSRLFAPHLPNALIDEALVITRKISEPTSPATGLVSLAPAQSACAASVAGLMLSPSTRRIGGSIFRLAFEATLCPY